MLSRESTITDKSATRQDQQCNVLLHLVMAFLAMLAVGQALQRGSSSSSVFVARLV